MSQVTENNVNAAPAPMTPLRSSGTISNGQRRGRRAGVCSHVILIAVFANFIAPYNLAEQFRDALPGAAGLAGRRQCWAHILGTDDVGRDVLSRLMYGAFVTAGRPSGGRPVAGNGDYSRPRRGLLRRSGRCNIIMRVVDIGAGPAEPAAGAGAGGDWPLHRQRAALSALTLQALPHYSPL